MALDLDSEHYSVQHEEGLVPVGQYLITHDFEDAVELGDGTKVTVGFNPGMVDFLVSAGCRELMMVTPVNPAGDGAALDGEPYLWHYHEMVFARPTLFEWAHNRGLLLVGSDLVFY